MQKRGKKVEFQLKEEVEAEEPLVIETGVKKRQKVVKPSKLVINNKKAGSSNERAE